MNTESLLEYVIAMLYSDKSNDWTEEIASVESAISDIARLRARIDELGGYHDDV